MRLNGWQRLWVVASVLSLGVMVVFVVSVQGSTNRVEDPEILRQLMSDEVIIAEVEGVGPVKFPDNLTKAEIGRYVKEGISTSPPTVAAIVDRLLKERVAKSAAEAKSQNEAVRSDNRKSWIVGLGVWLAFVLLLYLFGWAVGWVRRGFKAT